jgi:hypothetical protein
MKLHQAKAILLSSFSVAALIVMPSVANQSAKASTDSQAINQQSIQLQTFSQTQQIALTQNQSHRVKIWFDITGSDDGVGDNTLELYGEVRIGGNILCRFDRRNANRLKREAGQTLDCGTTTIDGSKMTINGNLMDYDSGSSDDVVFSIAPRVFDLISGRTYNIKQRQRGGEGATMYIRVD